MNEGKTDTEKLSFPVHFKRNQAV